MPSPKKAYLAGGCFWCMEPPFANLEGVESVIPGYSGGEDTEPSYEKVAFGLSDHRETAEISYDSDAVSFPELLEVFWKNIDPTDESGQFADRGMQYMTAIFYQNQEEQQQAEASKQALEASGHFDRPIQTEILPFTVFHPAEEKHHGYYRKNPTHYQLYKEGSGRGGFYGNNGVKKPQSELRSIQAVFSWSSRRAVTKSAVPSSPASEAV